MPTMIREPDLLDPDPWHARGHDFIDFAIAALSRVTYCGNQRILDLSCGAGTSTFRIASHVGRSCEVVGVDRSASAVRRAETLRLASGFENVVFAQRNAEVDGLGGPYHHVFSFFGSMSFKRPEHLLRNIRQAMHPGGTYTRRSCCSATTGKCASDPIWPTRSTLPPVRGRSRNCWRCSGRKQPREARKSMRRSPAHCCRSSAPMASGSLQAHGWLGRPNHVDLARPSRGRRAATPPGAARTRA
jgi:hypothetical protein